MSKKLGSGSGSTLPTWVIYLVSRLCSASPHPRPRPGTTLRSQGHPWIHRSRFLVAVRIPNISATLTTEYKTAFNVASMVQGFNGHPFLRSSQPCTHVPGALPLPTRFRFSSPLLDKGRLLQGISMLKASSDMFNFLPSKPG